MSIIGNAIGKGLGQGLQMYSGALMQDVIDRQRAEQREREAEAQAERQRAFREEERQYQSLRDEEARKQRAIELRQAHLAKLKELRQKRADEIEAEERKAKREAELYGVAPPPEGATPEEAEAQRRHNLEAKSPGAAVGLVKAELMSRLVKNPDDKQAAAALRAIEGKGGPSITGGGYYIQKPDGTFELTDLGKARIGSLNRTGTGGGTGPSNADRTEASKRLTEAIKERAKAEADIEKLQGRSKYDPAPPGALESAQARLARANASIDAFESVIAGEKKLADVIKSGNRLPPEQEAKPQQAWSDAAGARDRRAALVQRLAIVKNPKDDRDRMFKARIEEEIAKIDEYLSK